MSARRVSTSSGNNPDDGRPVNADTSSDSLRRAASCGTNPGRLASNDSGTTPAASPVRDRYPDVTLKEARAKADEERVRTRKDEQTKADRDRAERTARSALPRSSPRPSASARTGRELEPRGTTTSE